MQPSQGVRENFGKMRAEPDSEGPYMPWGVQIFFSSLDCEPLMDLRLSESD